MELAEPDFTEPLEGDELRTAPAEGPQLPDQHGFYKMPAKFGHIPVAEEPLGWDPQRRFEHLYPYVRLPTQVVERFEFGHPDLKPNRLFFGDNLHVMRSLPSESIDLIYIDPPFFSQQTYNVLFGDQNELRSFKDIWDGGLNGYLVWLNARLYEMKRLLKPSGLIYVHLDWHAGHYVKVELDRLFGYENFRNELVWCYSGGGIPKRDFPRKHDVILRYSKTAEYYYRPEYRAYSEGTQQRGRTKVKGVHAQLRDEGTPVTDWWADVEKVTSPTDPEKIGYPTQKSLALMQRIIETSSRPDDLVADFFCGGGSFIAAAAGLRTSQSPTGAKRMSADADPRRWIACDISRIAVSITADRAAKVAEDQEQQAELSRRSVAIPDFHVCHWGIYEVAGLAKMGNEQFRGFVLAAFEARPESTQSVIHGYKGAEPIFVGPPDPEKPIHKEEVAAFANAVLARRGSGGAGTMIAWAFTAAARKMAERIAAQQKLKLQFVKIRLLPLESPDFAAHVTSKAERYSNLLAFVLPPSIRCKHDRIGPRRYRFDISGSVTLNSGAKIINAQWDFDYQDYFTSTPGFELKRKKNGEPELVVDYEFPTAGPQEIAVRIQDDLGGEAIYRETIDVS